MESDELTQCTQNTQGAAMDPRRLGRNNSGLSAEDSSDVMCILHPGSPAAFKLVAETAQRAPQHILQDVSTPRLGFDDSHDMAEEQETFILDEKNSNTALDFAFRFSSKLVCPQAGFTFGRNAGLCDIAPSSDSHKRVSNQHFHIYINESGVLMIKDVSTNGTMVDDVLLRGKASIHPVSRMLSQGSIVQILTERAEEALKFIVRIPPRGEYEREYQQKCRDWIDRKLDAEVREKEEWDKGLQLGVKPSGRRARHEQPQGDGVTPGPFRLPLIQNHYGMHWDGGHKYNVVGQIGKGAFASVYQLATKSHGQLFAAKELEKRKFMKNGILDRKLENEMLIMQDIDHPSIVQYHEYQDVANHLYIIMEFVPCGDLQQYLGMYGALPEHKAKQMALQVFDALDYLHSKRITHRDIKPDNILLAAIEADNFVVKLSDFGLSKVVKDNDTFLKTFCGTLLYCAPEVFPHYEGHVSGKGTKRPRQLEPPQPRHKFHSYSQAVDIWSFGAVLWYALCTKPPFEGVADATGRGMFDKIMMTPLDTHDLDKQGTSASAAALMVDMLNTDPSSRPSAAACLRHPWLGDQRPPLRQQPDLVLGAIEEEEGEGEYEMVRAPDVGALTLDEHQQGGSNYSEVSLNSDDLNFFDPRKSKRFKTNDLEHRLEDDEELLDSSPELFESIPIMQERQDSGDNAYITQAKPPKLFGEISQSDFPQPVTGTQQEPVVQRDNSAVSDMQYGSGSASLNDVAENSEMQYGSGSALPHDVAEESDLQYGSESALLNLEQTSRQSGSLDGAEQLVRDMNVDSSYSRTSAVASESEMRPATPEAQEKTESHEFRDNPPQDTPRATENYPRAIGIVLPPSFFFDPSDPETHNLDYATALSGRDFGQDPAYTDKDASDVSLPDTTTSSHRSATDSVHESDNGHDDEASRESAIEETLSRPLYGRLIPTTDSIDYHMALHHPITTFGRSRRSTYVWPDQTDSRVGKEALTIFFGTGSLAHSQEPVEIESLYCNIMTHGSNGIMVNGVKLEKDTPVQHNHGRLYTGDEVQIYSKFGDKKALKFIVQINIGKSRTRRPRHGPHALFKASHATPTSTPRIKTKHSLLKQAIKGAQISIDGEL